MSRTLSGARARQLKRRATRADRRHTAGPVPARAVDTRDHAIRVQLGDARNRLRGLDVGRAVTVELIGRLERRLERAKA